MIDLKDKENFPELYKIINDQYRLNDLYSYNIVNTPNEKFFDLQTEVLATMFKVPYVAVSLIDKDKQWLKSAYGLNSNETDISVSFCKHLMNQTDQHKLIIGNALNDKRFQNNPAVKANLNIRYYAAVPIITSKKNMIGAICIADTNLRNDINLQDIEIMSKFSEVVLNYMESSRNIDHLNEYAKWMNQFKKI